MTQKIKIEKWFDTQRVRHQRVRFVLNELEDLFETLDKEEANLLIEEINTKYKLCNT